MQKQKDKEKMLSRFAIWEVPQDEGKMLKVAEESLTPEKERCSVKTC